MLAYFSRVLVVKSPVKSHEKFQRIVHNRVRETFSNSGHSDPDFRNRLINSNILISKKKYREFGKPF